MSDNRGFERADRVGQQLHREIARLFLEEINDPRLEDVEIIDVDLAPDLRNAKVFYMMLHGEAPSEDVGEALDGVVGFVRGELASLLELRYIPEIDFRFDESILRGRRIDELLTDLDDES